MRRHRTAAVLVLLLSAGLAVPGVVGAAQADKGQIHLTAAGQAAAKKAVLGRSDLGSTWRGGLKKPDLNSPDPVCKNGFHAKSSDLITIGAARSEWMASSRGPWLDHDVSLLKTPRMVKLDWQRSFTAPKSIECMREFLAKKFAKDGGTLVSLKQETFPKIAPLTIRQRVVVDVRSGNRTARVVMDAIMFGRGRTEHTLTATAFAATGGLSHSFEVKLARKLANRSS